LYNPNIYSGQECKNRKESTVKYAEELNVPFYEERDFFITMAAGKIKALGNATFVIH
jgi:predicted adenine nucleotide alpha hydrolase (AANH) superfamily ATPase